MAEQVESHHALLKQCPVAWQAQQTPTLIAIETDHTSVSYAQLHHGIEHLTQQLKELNMGKGDRLVSIAANGLPLVLLQLTCLRNGFIFCPINPKFTETEIKQRIALLDSRFIWQESNQYEINSLPLTFSSALASDMPIQPILINDQAIVSIIFTSGSSGTPKGVMHHFSNHYYSALGSQSIIPLQQGDANLLSLPLFHISGYATVIRTMLAGATLKISAQKICVSSLKKSKITHLSLVSSQLQQLLQDNQFQAEQLSLKHLLLGGSAFPLKSLQEARARGFTYHLSYGLTEMSSQVATSTNSEQLTVLPYRKLKVINGEVLLSGEVRFAGYFNGNISTHLLDKSDYFPSSDLGELNNQSLTINGRKDRQFISGGENIQPEEIEKVLLSCEYLSEAYVLPINDKVYGQRPIAFIKWANEAQLSALNTFMKDQLVAFKQPIHYLPLPKQKGMKVSLQQLQKLADVAF